MKPTWTFWQGNLSTPITKISLFLLLSIAFFFLAKYWSSLSSTSQLFFFMPSTTTSFSTHETLIIRPSNADKNFNITSLIQSPPPPPPKLEHFGVLDKNGVMQDDFLVGEDFNSDPMEDNWDDGSQNQTGVAGIVVWVSKFKRCPDGMKEYIPCWDNNEHFRGSDKFQRHCPKEGKGLNCLVPPPKGYKLSLRWPASRDEIWYSNVPHTRLVDDKGGQNRIKKEKNKFKFPGGGTQFIHGAADQYLNQISKMVPDVAFGSRTRVALDIGCGVASFGAFLLSRNVLTLSVAPKDVHENQIQFALERGVPAMIAAFAARHLLYPSQAFDLIHCSRCGISWINDDGILLLEVNRMLRAGGFFVWVAQPVDKHEEAQQETWKEMEDLTTRMCWELVKKEGYIAIWKKPSNNICYLSRERGTEPPLCDVEDDQDNVWYVDMKPCITRLPEDGHGAIVGSWPARLHYPSDRIQSVVMDAFLSKKDLFQAESRYWTEVVGSYVRAFHWKKLNFRNVMDMRAGFGGFAAAMIYHKIDCWTMNVVPTSEPNTLPVIYDRGLLGVAHDWCESFDTYPRTYDLLHAADLFSKEQKRCNISSILLEMDRILRPGGRAFFRDNKIVIEEINHITEAMGWRCNVGMTEEGPYANRRLLMCEKLLIKT